jgi:hypothetical protein
MDPADLENSVKRKSGTGISRLQMRISFLQGYREFSVEFALVFTALSLKFIFI